MIGDQVTRARPEQAGTDRYGKPTITLGVPVDIGPALFDPGGSTIAHETGRDPVTTVPTLYFPDAWPDIKVRDQVTVRGERFVVTGIPARWRRPGDGLVAGLVAHLERIDG